MSLRLCQPRHSALLALVVLACLTVLCSATAAAELEVHGFDASELRASLVRLSAAGSYTPGRQPTSRAPLEVAERAGGRRSAAADSRTTTSGSPEWKRARAFWQGEAQVAPPDNRVPS